MVSVGALTLTTALGMKRDTVVSDVVEKLVTESISDENEEHHVCNVQAHALGQFG